MRSSQASEHNGPVKSNGRYGIHITPESKTKLDAEYRKKQKEEATEATRKDQHANDKPQLPDEA